MTGHAWWAFRGSPRHAELLAAGWEETRAWKLVHGELVSVLMVKVSATSASEDVTVPSWKNLGIAEWRNSPLARWLLRTPGNTNSK